MATYTLIGSYATVQALTPTLTNPVEYCSIQTQPSGVVASLPVQKSVFDAGQAGVELTNFATAVEQIMADSRVIAGIGSQTIDDNGLLADFVVFTVQYSGPGAAPEGVTAQADVPVGMLNFTDGEIGTVLLAQVEALITAAYDSLAAAAGA